MVEFKTSCLNTGHILSKVRCLICHELEYVEVVSDCVFWGLRALLLFYSYCQRRVLGSRGLLVVYVFIFYQTLRVVPHGTKGTSQRFVTRPVYLRSQFKNNTNTVSTLVLLIHLFQVLWTRYVSVAHHRALQTSG